MVLQEQNYDDRMFVHHSVVLPACSSTAAPDDHMFIRHAVVFLGASNIIAHHHPPSCAITVIVMCDSM
jgi:hypothetical protein